LTRDVGALQAVAPGLSRQVLRKWQRRDINRKVDGSRAPRVLWQQWTQEQREMFEQLCSPAMRSLGYEMRGK
jgi:hypothetical protein